MSIGDGIFWSTVIVLLYITLFQISKHHKWMLILKLLGVLVLIIAIAVGGYSYYETIYKRKDSSPHELMSFKNIDLGMTQLEVTLAKGEPSRVIDKDSPSKIFYYESENTAVYIKSINKNFIVQTICSFNDLSGVFGLNTFSNENDIKMKLGHEFNVSIRKDGLRKMIFYPHYNVAFTLKSNLVTDICVSSKDNLRFTEEHPDTIVVE